MTLPLPDVALDETATALLPLDWVGMQGIDLPLLLDEPGVPALLHARVDVQVDLPEPSIKGIHMSRLYRLLDRLSGPEALTAQRLAEVLEAMVASHADCHSTQARLQLRFALLSRRPALISAGLGGWKGYPVTLTALWRAGQLQLDAQVEVGYSSTCPCSAALARQVVETAFNEAFAGSETLSPASVAQWLRANATAATPHSQRSIARVSVAIAPNAPSLGLLARIERIEQALATPLQTAVKRADEQAFARLNGQNLMYVEDAARRIRLALGASDAAVRVFVEHQESLHPHDAVAWAS